MIGAVGDGSLCRVRRWSWGTGVVPSRIRGCGWGFRGGKRMDLLLFPLPLPWHFRKLALPQAGQSGSGGEKKVKSVLHPDTRKQFVAG